MSRWIGRWLMAVGVIHCVVGGIPYATPLIGMAQDGLWNTIHRSAERQAAFWFVFSGLLTIVLGALVDWIEQAMGRWPSFLAYGVLVLNLLAITVLPAGGGWLLLPATVGLLIRKQHGDDRTTVAHIHRRSR